MKCKYYDVYIFRLLKTLCQKTSITLNAKEQLNSCICNIANIFSNKIFQHMSENRKTIIPKEIKEIIFFLFEDELSNEILKYSEDSIINLKNSYVIKNKISRQKRANIIFPISLSEKFLKRTNFKLSKNTAIYFTCTLEYICKQILICAIKNKTFYLHSRITIRDLELGIQSDIYLTNMFRKFNLYFLGGGVVPEIHESLLNKKYKRKKKESDKKPRRFRPGTVSIRQIKKIQKTSDCLIFPKLHFEDIIREIVSKYNDKIKIAKNVFIILQYYIEQHIVNFLKNTNCLAIHCGRVKVLESDLNLISKLENNI